MSFDAARNALKQLFESLTYTNKYNEAQPVNVYFETDLENAKSKFKTPAIVVRGVTSLTSPISIGWNEWRELGELTVSLYTKQRATDYNAESVMEEVNFAPGFCV